jgi:hypothetical protein
MYFVILPRNCNNLCMFLFPNIMIRLYNNNVTKHAQMIHTGRCGRDVAHETQSSGYIQLYVIYYSEISFLL